MRMKRGHSPGMRYWKNLHHLTIPEDSFVCVIRTAPKPKCHRDIPPD